MKQVCPSSHAIGQASTNGSSARIIVSGLKEARTNPIAESHRCATMLETRFVMTNFSGLIAYDRPGASSYELEESQVQGCALPIGAKRRVTRCCRMSKSGSTLTENW